MGSQVYIFRNRISSCNYVFEDGTVANFTGGVYTTDDESKAKELQMLVDGVQKKRDSKGNEVFDKDGNNIFIKTRAHPHIFQEDGVRTVDSDQLDPLWALKQQLREELRIEMGLADPNRDMGTSTPGPLVPTSTRQIASAEGGKLVNMPNALIGKLNQLMMPVARTGDPEPNPNAVPNGEAAPGNAVVPESASQVAGISAAESFQALLAAQAATKQAIVNPDAADAAGNGTSN